MLEKDGGKLINIHPQRHRHVICHREAVCLGSLARGREGRGKKAIFTIFGHSPRGPVRIGLSRPSGADGNESPDFASRCSSKKCRKFGPSGDISPQLRGIGENGEG